MSITRSILVVLMFAASFAWAQKQQPIPVPEFHPTSAGNISSALKGAPPDLKLLSKEPGSRTGQLWIRNLGNALLIAGQIDGDAPQFPRNKNEILSKDHIEVWLATTPDVPLPPVGWGHQFGEQLLPRGPDSCAEWVKGSNPDASDRNEREKECRTWAAKQQQYRMAFKKLFVRQWLLTPDFSSESYATPAYELITAKYAPDPKTDAGQALTMLQPKGEVHMTYASGYNFQIQIPYSAFPPVNTLELKNLWLMVDVFSSAAPGKRMGPYSSSSPLRAFGKPETFNQLQLQPQRSFQLSPCGAGLEGRDKYGNKHRGWFLPAHDQGARFEADSFIVVNEAEGYAYDPSGLSPVARTIHHFWQKLGPDEWICGPDLAYRKALSAKRYEERVDEQGLAGKRLQDGTLLIKSGPLVYYSEFGSGQCGACPRYDLHILALDKNLKAKQVLSLGGVFQGDDDAADFALSPNWLQVIHYQQQRSESNDENAKPTWLATTYCLRDMEYVKCGEKKDVQPPNSPLLKELQAYLDQSN